MPVAPWPLGGCRSGVLRCVLGNEVSGVPGPAHFLQRRCPHALGLRAARGHRQQPGSAPSSITFRASGSHWPLAPCPSGYSPASSSSGGCRITGRGPGVTGRVGARTLQAERAQWRHPGVRSPSGMLPVSQRPGFTPCLLPGLLRPGTPTHPHSPTCPALPSVSRSPPCLRGCRPTGQGSGPECPPGAVSPVPTHRAGRPHRRHRRVPHPARSGARWAAAGRSRADTAGTGTGTAPAPPRDPAPPGTRPPMPVPGAPGPTPAPTSCIPIPIPIPASLPTVCLGSDLMALSHSCSALSGSPPARGVLQPPCPLCPLASP